MKLNRQVDLLKDELITSVQEILKIRSLEDEAQPGMPFGTGVAEALGKALELAKNMGFKTVNLDGYVGYAEYGEGEDYIAVLGHLDVVPEESGWLYPPYGGEIIDGKIYGRGAVDDKGPILAALYALKAIKDLDIKLSKKVRIIFGTNEETGCLDMEYYTRKEKAPLFGFTPDGNYPVIHGEKGILHFNIIKEIVANTPTTHKLSYIKAGNRLNIVPDYCEVAIISENKDDILNLFQNFLATTESKLEISTKEKEIIIKAYGKSAHGSMPHFGINAIAKMLIFLENIDFQNKDITSFINFFNKNINNETAGESLGMGFKDDVSGNLSFNVGKIELNSDRIVLGCDIRFPVTFQLNHIIETLEKNLTHSNLQFEILSKSSPLYFPLEHPLVKILHNVFREQTGSELQPVTIGGGTYAKYLPNTLAYGTIMPGKEHLEHQANEYIEIEDLILDAKIYAHAIFELAK